MTEVVNIYHQKPFDVYCGREGKGEDGYFGNHTYKYETFRDYFYKRLETDSEYRSRIESLKGKKLGCFCAPKHCHVMIYIEYLEGKTPEQQMREYTEKMGKYVQPNIFDDFT